MPKYRVWMQRESTCMWCGADIAFGWSQSGTKRALDYGTQNPHMCAEYSRWENMSEIDFYKEKDRF